MKKINRCISLLTIMIMLLGCMVMPVQAASTGTVTVRSVQDYSEVQSTLKAINKQRKKHGLKPVKLDKRLTKLAVRRAAESAVYMDSKHTRPNGKDCLTVGKKVNRENWAGGYETGKIVVNEWMHSPGHKRNILASDAKSVGIAFISTGYYTYSVLLMSKSSADKVLKTKSGTKVYNIKVTAKSKYIKKKFFEITWPAELATYGYEDVSIEPGTSTQLYVTHCNKYTEFTDAHTQLTPKSFKWKTSNSKVATISSTGKLTAKKAGKVTITATMKNSPKYVIKRTITIEEDDDYYYY